jgi:N-acetyl-1-D-myo-inositol-2-amino-2-deoxy-alpha-D-glucopyranoside deacetylase/mycothiol S-conjugate amidase
MRSQPETIILRPTMVDTRPTLLAVFAHPDDESFGPGGTLARYAWSGVAVHLICATGGEEGTVDPALLNGYQSVAELRRAELLRAAEALGLSSVTLLGYRDSGMPGTAANTHPDALINQPREQVVEQIVRRIRQLHPQVVITFDPIGGYCHPDHIAIHEATVAAFHAAGNPSAYPSAGPAYAPQKLYYTTFSRRLLRLVVRLMPLFGRDPRAFGRNRDVDLTKLADVAFPTHARIDTTAVREQVQAAAAAHLSQGGGGPFTRGPLSTIVRLLGSVDTFMRAYPPATNDVREDDLFAGVVW